MKIVVTGATGFIGSHLADRLVARGDEVSGWIRPGRSRPRESREAVKYREVDLMNRASVLSEFADFMPDALFHLAAQSLPSASWSRPWETIQVNVAGALNLFEAVRDVQFQGPLFVAGSSSEYAAQKDPARPIAEDHPIHASSPYAVSKIAVDQLAQLFGTRHGLKIIRFRPFFWIGTRKTGDFCSDIARRIVDVENGVAKSVKVGNLEAIRDFLDVADGVEALMYLLKDGSPGSVYNICSGIGVRLREVVDLYTKMSSAKITIEVTPELLRPLDESVRVGNPSKMMALGWKSVRPIHKTLFAILEYHRKNFS
jgi:GDP-4-dehydro-6-deoxy-D-mannose reductase